MKPFHHYSLSFLKSWIDKLSYERKFPNSHFSSFFGQTTIQAVSIRKKSKNRFSLEEYTRHLRHRQTFSVSKFPGLPSFIHLLYTFDMSLVSSFLFVRRNWFQRRGIPFTLFFVLLLSSQCTKNTVFLSHHLINHITEKKRRHLSFLLLLLY